MAMRGLTSRCKAAEFGRKDVRASLAVVGAGHLLIILLCGDRPVARSCWSIRS